MQYLNNDSNTNSLEFENYNYDDIIIKTLIFGDDSNLIYNFKNNSYISLLRERLLFILPQCRSDFIKSFRLALESAFDESIGNVSFNVDDSSEKYCGPQNKLCFRKNQRMSNYLFKFSTTFSNDNFDDIIGLKSSVEKLFLGDIGYDIYLYTLSPLSNGSNVNVILENKNVMDSIKYHTYINTIIEKTNSPNLLPSTIVNIIDKDVVKKFHEKILIDDDKNPEVVLVLTETPEHMESLRMTIDNDNDVRRQEETYKPGEIAPEENTQKINETRFYNIIYQIVYTIKIFLLAGINHCDLNIDNVLIEKKSDRQALILDYFITGSDGNIDRVIINTHQIVKITDYTNINRGKRNGNKNYIMKRMLSDRVDLFGLIMMLLKMKELSKNNEVRTYCDSCLEMIVIQDARYNFQDYHDSNSSGDNIGDDDIDKIYKSINDIDTCLSL